MTSSAPLSFGLVDARPVFMDLTDDSYFMLEPEDEAEFLELIATGRRTMASSSSLQQALGTCQWIKCSECERPQRSLTEELGSGARTSIVDAARAAVLLRSTRRAITRQPIEDVLGGLTAHISPPADHSDCQLALAMRFITARRLVPIKPNCLLDSIALLRWLGEAAADASLVFGVKLAPFAAHCWVQNDAALLNDLPDHVGRFEPVRVIRCSAPTR